MKIFEINNIEEDVIIALKERAISGDNHAAQVLFTQLNEQRNSMTKWKESQPPRVFPKKKKEESSSNSSHSSS